MKVSDIELFYAVGRIAKRLPAKRLRGEAITAHYTGQKGVESVLLEVAYVYPMTDTVYNVVAHYHRKGDPLVQEKTFTFVQHRLMDEVLKLITEFVENERSIRTLHKKLGVNN